LTIASLTGCHMAPLPATMAIFAAPSIFATNASRLGSPSAPS
jgi:hypothetical protein